MANIVKLNTDNQDQLTSQAAQIIKSGGVVILPFDTVYGFACDARNNAAILKIFELKNRDLSSTIGIAVNSWKSLDKIGETETHRDFIKKNIPGKYTFIVQAKKMSISNHCQKDDTIGIRVPDSKFILDIIAKSGGLIAQTSANKTGLPNCFSIDEVKNELKDRLEVVDLIIDGGQIKSQGPSEIIDLTDSDPINITRKS